MGLSRRRALGGLGGALLAPAVIARAEAPWPSQSLKIVVPYPPGGLTDVAGRMLSDHLQTAFGQTVIVDNKAGAGTQIGASYVAKQPADGYTLLLATVSTLCITPALYAKPMITHSDFTGVAMLGDATLILVGRPDLPAANPRDLVALLGAKPGGYTYGSPGIGSVHHLLTELMLSRHKVNAVHVPYPGSVKAVVDLAGSRLDFMFVDATVALPQITTAKIKAFAVTGSARQPGLLDVPAITEFFPALDPAPWLSIAAPTGTPANALERLNGEINKALGLPQFGDRLRQLGLEPRPLTLAAFGDFIKRDVDRWAEMVKISGARAD
jgi:tripartite-type tricarboxylate transporter receptor subunit TctC